MDFDFFLKGLLIGFYIAAPIGPISLLCIKRTLNSGKKIGVASAFGVVSAEIFYACVAIYGLTLISDFLIGQKFYLQICGGIFLLYLGASTFVCKPQNKIKVEKKTTIAQSYLSIFFLTLANPMTIINFVAIFASFGLDEKKSNFTNASLSLAGFIFSSLLCYLILVTITSILRTKFNEKMMQIVNRISGIMIAGFAIFILSGSVK